MHHRHPLPRLWLMTDERQGESLWSSLEQLPPGSGIVFRHYSLSAPQRRKLFDRIAKVARRRHLLLLLAGTAECARRWGAAGSHGREFGRLWPRGLRSAPAHDLKEIQAAERAGADLIFLSPVFATRSHPGARTLGRTRFALLARQTKLPVIALGGMNRRRAESLSNAYGWAGIDAWSD